MGGLRGATALVTGASRGIGLAIARGLIAEGARPILTARDETRLAVVAAELGAFGVAADLTVRDGIGSLTDEVRRHLGSAPDILVNNAGALGLAPAWRVDSDELDRQLALNLRAPILLVGAFLPEMLERGSGALVHVGSVAGRQPFPENSIYAATKFGLRGYHEVLSLELEETGVRSLLIEPGAVDTDAWDPLEPRLGRDLPARSAMGTPSAVAAEVIAALGVG